MNILQLTCHFRPNVGGVETHLDDLVTGLIKMKHAVFVLTYRPLMSDEKWQMMEIHEQLTIFRIPWIKGYFYRLIKSPLIEFLYLFPGLYIVLPIILINKKIDVIHSHGLVAGFVGMFWGKVFGIKTIVSTHSIYEFPKNGLYPFFAKWMFNATDKILTLSKQSKNELEILGVNKDKISVFTYWVDLDKFRPMVSKHEAKSQLGWKYGFVVLFVGRLVEEKGVLVLLDAATKWNKNITLIIIGTGPLSESIKDYESRIKNIKYLGKVENEKLPQYYNSADVTIIPSIHEEGFGRVILESLACGTPVIGSNRGAVPEAMDNTVGRLIEVKRDTIIKSVEKLYKDSKELSSLTKNTRTYAQKKYSVDNINIINSFYE